MAMFISAAGFSGRRTTLSDSPMTDGGTFSPRSSSMVTPSAFSARSIGRSRGSQATSIWMLPLPAPEAKSRTTPTCFRTTRNGPVYRSIDAAAGAGAGGCPSAGAPPAIRPIDPSP
jgi:hypothetical protein